MYDVVSWHVIFGSDHRKYMVYVNASVEARSALIPPVMFYFYSECCRCGTLNSISHVSLSH